MITIACPECQQPIELRSDLVIGYQTKCQTCGTDFVVTWLFPISLDYVESNETGIVHSHLS